MLPLLFGLDGLGTADVHRQTVYRWVQGEQAPDVWHWAVLGGLLPSLGLPGGN